MADDFMKEYQKRFGELPPIGFLPFPISELEERMKAALKIGKPIELDENKIY